MSNVLSKIVVSIKNRTFFTKVKRKFKKILNKNNSTSNSELAALYAQTEALSLQIKSLTAQLDNVTGALGIMQNNLAETAAKNQTIMWQCFAADGETNIEARKRFFRTLPPAVGTVRYVQTAVLILMKKLDSICRANGLIYWLDFDTLLGAIRHGGFVPWVCDATIGMPRSDADKLTQLLSHDQDICAEDEYTVIDGIFRRRLQVRYRNIESGNEFFCVNIHLFDYCRSESMALWNKHLVLRAAFDTEFDRLSKSKTLISPDNRQDKYMALFKAHKTKADKAVGASQTPTAYIISAFDNPAVGDAVKYCYRVADMFPLENILFEGYNFQAPVCPEKFVLKQYMDMYDIPDVMSPDINSNKNNEIYQGLEFVFDKYGINIENIE